MTTILVLNGPNLNLLGTREPEVYGSATLDDIIADLTRYAQERSVTIEHVQSNHEGVLIDALHAGMGRVDGVILNAGAFTHTSVALRDAITGTSLPVVETHLSNVYARDEFRHHSYLAAACLGTVGGFGADSYRVAFEALHRYLDEAR